MARALRAVAWLIIFMFACLIGMALALVAVYELLIHWP